MNWSNVKTILIIFMAAVNLVLGSFYAFSLLREHSAREQVREDTLIILRNLGVEIGAETIPPVSSKLFPARFTRDAELEKELIQRLIGRTQVSEKNGENLSYHGENGSALVKKDGTFEITVLNAEKGYEDIFRRSGLEYRPEDAEYSPENGGRFAAAQRIMGTPVFNAEISAIIKNDGSCIFTGRWMPRQPEFIKTARTQNVEGLILSLVAYMKKQDTPCETIEKIEYGYELNSVLGGETALSPAWRVTANGRIWLINAVTGQVTAYENTVE